MRYWFKIAVIFALGLAPGLVSASTVAGQANQRNILPGGRASMMGGAYTALAEDASGGYYNPAGLGFIGDRSFDIAATAYRTQSVTYKNAINNEALNQESTDIFPSFIGVASKVGPLVLGYSFVTLENRTIYQQNSFNDISTVQGSPANYEQTHQEENTYVLAGGSAALPIGDNFAIGLSLHYYQRDITATTIQLSSYNGGRIWSTTHTFQTLNTGVSPVFGVKWRLGILDLGASVRTARAISDGTTIITDQIIYDPTFDSTSAPTTRNDTYTLDQLNELNPTTYRMGFAVKPADWFTLAGDVLVHEGRKNYHIDGNKHDFLTTYNYSLGMELGTAGRGLRAGYFTNYSMFREPTTSRVNQPPHIDYTGYSLGFGWRVAGFNGEIGMVDQSGHGKAQILTDSQSIQEVDAHNRFFMISGTIPVN